MSKVPKCDYMYIKNKQEHSSAQCVKLCLLALSLCGVRFAMYLLNTGSSPIFLYIDIISTLLDITARCVQFAKHELLLYCVHSLYNACPKFATAICLQ